MAQALVMGAVFTLIGRSSVSGIPVALFIFTGILPFKMFSKLLPQLSAAVKANKPLLAYRQVSAIDPIVARVLLEVAIFIVAYVLIFGLMAWLGFNVIPHDLLASKSCGITLKPSHAIKPKMSTYATIKIATSSNTRATIGSIALTCR